MCNDNGVSAKCLNQFSWWGIREKSLYCSLKDIYNREQTISQLTSERFFGRYSSPWPHCGHGFQSYLERDFMVNNIRFVDENEITKNCTADFLVLSLITVLTFLAIYSKSTLFLHSKPVGLPALTNRIVGLVVGNVTNMDHKWTRTMYSKPQIIGKTFSGTGCLVQHSRPSLLFLCQLQFLYRRSGFKKLEDLLSNAWMSFHFMSIFFTRYMYQKMVSFWSLRQPLLKGLTLNFFDLWNCNTNLSSSW